jgi:sulfate adenylyltransferase subunit 2
MDKLHQLENETIFILREAFARVKPLAMLWSMGKDSTALLWMARKAFLGRIPFPVALLDTGMEMPEVYAFRDRIAAEWQLELINQPCPPESAIDPTLPPASRAAARKTEGLRSLIKTLEARGIIVGIRRDEQSMRGKERVFSPRGGDHAWHFQDQPPELWDLYHTDYPAEWHLRVHPLLGWTELDIWRYTEREGIPVVPLYFSRGGWRYRSLGERNITKPVRSDAASISDIIAELEVTRVPERSGRVMDSESEDSFERLRRSGYM